ncbi:MAG: hypothetical protein ACR2MP_18005 [Streptosporangiaceae bacterium]
MGTVAALNAHAASHFSARDIIWMHASYGLGAITGPLLVTALLSDGLSWRSAYGIMAAAQGALAVVFALTRRNWPAHPRSMAASMPRPEGCSPKPAGEAAPRKPPAAMLLSALTCAAVETGIESGAGIWGYVFLTDGRAWPAASGRGRAR